MNNTQFDAIMQVLAQMSTQISALDKKIDDSVAMLRAEMAELATALRAEMTEMAVTLRTEMAELATTLRTEMAEQAATLRAEMAGLATTLRSEMVEGLAMVLDAQHNPLAKCSKFCYNINYHFRGTTPIIENSYG